MYQVHAPGAGLGEALAVGDAVGDAVGEGLADVLPVGLGDGDPNEKHGAGVGIFGNSRIERVNVTQNCVCCPLQFG